MLPTDMKAYPFDKTIHHHTVMAAHEEVRTLSVRLSCGYEKGGRR